MRGGGLPDVADVAASRGQDFPIPPPDSIRKSGGIVGVAGPFFESMEEVAEEGGAFGPNPSSRFVAVRQLESYSFGSYRRLWKPKARPEWLSIGAALSAAGKLSDNAKGWMARGYLRWLLNELKGGENRNFLS